MKTQNTKTDDEVESMLQQERKSGKAEAWTSGKFNGLKSPSQPLLKGDKLIHYISPIKARCEQLAMQVLQKCQPASFLPEGRIDADWAEILRIRMQEGIDKIENTLSVLGHELGGYNPATIATRILLSILSGVGLFIGEVALNTQAFQVTGDNFLSCLILSISVSGVISAGAHFAGRKYKDAKTKLERRVVLIVSFVGMSIVAGVIASLRSLYFKKIGVEVNPIYFAIFNVVFFLIAAIAAWYIYPTKEEIEANRENLQKHKQMEKLKKELKQEKQLLAKHEHNTKEQFKENTRTILKAEYAIATVISIYHEEVEEFKSANMHSRKGVPDCFSDPIPPLNIPHITFYSAANKYKNQNNNQNTNSNNNQNNDNYENNNNDNNHLAV